MEVPEPDGEDDGGAKVVAPNVLLTPGHVVDLFLDHPVVGGVEVGNGDEDAGQDVADEQVHGDDFGEVPVLLLVRKGQKLTLQLCNGIHV